MSTSPRKTDSFQFDPSGSWKDIDDQALLAHLSNETLARREEIWAEIVRRWQGRLFAFARSITRKNTVAEDVVQETFLELWKAATIKGTEFENLKGWLFKLASRKALRAMQSRRRKSKMESNAQEQINARALTIGKIEGEAKVEIQELKESLHNLVGNLPERLRIPVLLHFGSGFTQDEIAKLIGCQQSTISDRLEDALLKLKHGLGRIGHNALPAALPTLLGEALTTVEIPLGAACTEKILSSASTSTEAAINTSTVKINSGALLLKSAIAALALVVVAASLNHWNTGNDAPPTASSGLTATTVQPPSSLPLNWNFDSADHENWEAVQLTNLFLDSGSVEKKYLEKYYSDINQGIQLLPKRGKTGGGLGLRFCWGIVLPVDMTEEPLEISFDQGDFREIASGLMSWPEQLTTKPLQRIITNVRRTRKPPENPDDWLHIKWYLWQNEGKQYLAFTENGRLNAASVHERHESKTIRPYLAGKRLQIDNLTIRLANMDAFQDIRNTTYGLLEDQRQNNTPSEPLLAWKPFTDDKLTVPDKRHGTWETQKSPDGLSISFHAKENKRQKSRSFCYVGENRETSFEMEGILEYAGSSNKKSFSVDLGICHPNRFNYSGVVWKLPKNSGPWLFRLQVTISAFGLQRHVYARDTEGKEYFGTDSGWLTDSTKEKKEPKPEGNEKTIGWTGHVNMRSWGLAFASTESIRITNLRFRPLVKENMMGRSLEAPSE